MQAILAADYSFTPIEYWRNVSETARDFIRRCLTVNPLQRMTAHQALQHAWIKPVDPTSPEKPSVGEGQDLLPTVKKNFNARRTLHKAIDTVRAINKLREGGGLIAGKEMDDAMSMDPKPKSEMVYGSKVMNDQGQPMEGIAQGGSGEVPVPQGGPVGGDGDAMEVDSRGHGRCQTQEMIQKQQEKIRDTVKGLWDRR